MLKIKKSNKKKIVMYMIIIIGVAFLISNKIRLVTNVASLIFNPIQSKIYKIADNISEIADGVSNFKELLAENKSDREKIALLETENKLLKNLEEENIRLKTLLELKQGNHNFKIATVIFRHIDELYEILYIDLGERDGIKKDMAVALGDKLVGKVKVVENEMSQIELITNQDFKVSVINDRDVLGIAKVDDEDNGKMVFIPSINGNIEVGDTITTSGISDLFPKGLILGKITSKAKEEGEFYIEPAIDVLKIKEVIIIGKGDKIE